MSRPSAIILLSMLFAGVLSAAAQSDTVRTQKKKERTVDLYGEVYDSFTKAKVKAFVTLMQQDSTVVDTMTCWTWGTSSVYQFKIPARQGRYIIKGSCEGYDDAYLNYHLRYIARNNYFELPRLLMKKRQDDIWREDSLGGVVVTGTRVKIAYRGDTIVYNASAFNLPEGSMLDGLIRQMPGAELKNNGDIYINGKKVDYLMLNGKDFFRGNNKVMLDNLPYYTVQNIKVYDKSTRESQLIGRDVEKKDYVMDVVLKREYNRGHIANAEAGAGTDRRYLARLFGMYYDDHTRLSVFGNVNNVNENRRPGSEGEWSPANMPQGQHTNRQTGLSLNTEDQDKRWEENMDATVAWITSENESRTTTETFADNGNITSGSSAWSRQRQFSVAVNNYFAVSKPFTLWTNLGLNYGQGRSNSLGQDSTYRQYITNQSASEAFSRTRALGINGNVGFHHKFDWGDALRLFFNATYSQNKPGDNFRRTDAAYRLEGTTDHREYYNDQHDRQYQYQAHAAYTLQLPDKWYIEPYAGYTQTMLDNHDTNYRLDWLGSMTPHELGWLPSTREALESVIDPNNTTTHLNLSRIYQSGIEVNHNDDNSFLSLRLPVSHTRERMHFDDMDIDTIAHRHFTHFEPRISYYTWGKKKGFESATYGVSVSRPDFASLMPGDDTTNPLILRIVNPDLKARITHTAGVSFHWANDSLKRSTRLYANASMVDNAWGTHTTYDPSSGIYTYENDNIDGNWQCSVNLNHQRPLDRQKRLTLSQENGIAYDHSTDFDVLSVSGTAAWLTSHPTSTVHNLTVTEDFKLEYQREKLTASVSAKLAYRLSTSRRTGFQRINAFDYDYGAALTYTIPWVSLDLATDLRMFSRRGYYSPVMNDDHLVWNAQLSHTFTRQRLTAKLVAFDLLHQLSTTQYSVNAQGRTETWNNSLPRYMMLSLMKVF